MSLNSYAIVYDLPVSDDGEQYTIVLKKWLHEKETITYLSYPTSKEYQKSLRLKRNPDKLWSVAAVQVVGYYDTYEQAKAKETKLLQYKSSSEVDEENVTHRNNKALRKHCTSRRDSDFHYEEDQDSLSPLPLPNQNKLDEAGISLEDVPVVIIPPHEEIGIVNPSAEVESPASSADSMVSNQAVFKLLRHINDQLVKCDLLLQSHTDKLNGIEKKLNILPFQQDIPVLSIELPLKTVEKLERFEETLKDETQSAALKHILKRLVESTERSSVFKMLSKMFDFELATICSWKGRKQNYRIENLALIKILIETVHDSFPYAKDGVIEHAGIDWFRAAQQRFARRKNTLQ